MMDLDLTPTPSNSPDDTENDTPPHTEIQSIKPLSFINGALKKLHDHHQPPPRQSSLVVTYKECMKNHAANLGGHAVDGCGEFMPSPSATNRDPTSLKCAACGCHRNFHRREPDDPSPTSISTPPFLNFRHPPPPRRSSVSPSPPPPQSYAFSPHMLMALSTAVAAEEHMHQAPVTPMAENPVGRKRFRTKFSNEQKEKMQSFSEKLGWKIQKTEQAAIEKFCREIGVTRGVLKVWMHNNKSNFSKKEINTNTNTNNNTSNSTITNANSNSNSNSIINGKMINFQNNGCGKNEEIGSHFQNESGGAVHFHVSNNGSSPSP